MSVIAVVAALPNAAAQDVAETLGASVESVLEAGRRLSPELQAAALDTEAAAARADSAAPLSDPTIQIMNEGDRIGGSRMHKTSVLVQQEFPLWGKRGLKRSSALAALDAALGRERATAAALDEAIKRAFADYYAASRALAINAEVGRVSKQMATLAAERYGQGLGEQSDAITAEAEYTRALVAIERAKSNRISAVARLNALLARPANAPFAEPMLLRALPAQQLTLENLIERANATSPQLFAQGAEINAAESARELTERAWYPDITLGGGSYERDDGRADYRAMVGVSIPLQWGAKRAAQREASANLRAARYRLNAMTATLQGDLEAELAKLTAARNVTLLLRDQLVPQVEAAHKSLLDGYARGRGDLASVLEAEHRLHDARIELLQAEIEGQAALAAIERLIGGDL